jgi:hypothetical protein
MNAEEWGMALTVKVGAQEGHRLVAGAGVPGVAVRGDNYRQLKKLKTRVYRLLHREFGRRSNKVSMR